MVPFLSSRDEEQEVADSLKLDCGWGYSVSCRTTLKPLINCNLRNSGLRHGPFLGASFWLGRRDYEPSRIAWATIGFHRA
jgi:hypothetical protein